MAIDLLLQDVKRLHIGADNIAEPELEEDAFHFLGRVWETIRPRDNTVLISEHISELRKPEDTTATQVVAQLTELSGEISGAFSSFFQAEQAKDAKDAKDDCSTAAPTSTSRSSCGSTDESGTAPSNMSMGSLFSYFLQPGQQKQALGRSSAGPDAPDEPEGSSQRCAAPQAAAVEEQAAAVVAVSDSTARADSAETAAAPVVPAAATAAAAAPAPPAEAANDEPVEPAVVSTVLVEATLVLDDGSVAVCKVTAADRCKEVAKRFVEEHSLKAVFAAPLTAFLQKAEADAPTFPVSVKGDLMEIREDFCVKGGGK
eukprot:TRINITY_DN7962_c0_g1_i1.p2 TRINITY_DN7962_c0_g1~~TRINITY_DN7962_c0_g1_i1.p2  ORF type:complete len:315 (+),score=109.46 TRINITY_DN7962_c0_g1_i1:177-1121(+)